MEGFGRNGSRCPLLSQIVYLDNFNPSSNAADAMDGYYGCLWDGTLLEVAVALHNRRGEGGRKARTVKAAGALELNANNSEDIQREAAAIRRARLLRALTNQYVA